MFSELETVVLTRDIAEHGLKSGDIGAVVHSYQGGTAFEVEFVTGGGGTIAVLTLKEDDLRPVGAREVLHARELTQATSL
jgi:hypothetical protein